MREFICIKKCFHKGRLFKRNDPYVVSDDKEEVPHHFVAAGGTVPEEQTPRLGKLAKTKANAAVRSPGKDAAAAAKD